jgi:hypothetical protein
MKFELETRKCKAWELIKDLWESKQEVIKNNINLWTQELEELELKRTEVDKIKREIWYKISSLKNKILIYKKRWNI